MPWFLPQKIVTYIKERFSYTHINGWRPGAGGASYLSGYREVLDEEGIPAQGTSNPVAVFNNHALVRIGGKLYDPSYGGHGPYDSLEEYEQINISTKP